MKCLGRPTCAQGVRTDALGERNYEACGVWPCECSKFDNDRPTLLKIRIFPLPGTLKYNNTR